MDFSRDDHGVSGGNADGGSAAHHHVLYGFSHGGDITVFNINFLVREQTLIQ